MNDMQLDCLLKGTFDSIHTPDVVLNTTRNVVSKDASEIQPTKQRLRPSRARTILAIAACLVLVAIIPVGMYLYNDVRTIVTMDINPSVELSLNRFNIVVNAAGMNADGQELLDANPVKGMPCEAALEKLMMTEQIQNAVEDNNALEVVVFSVDGSSTTTTEEIVKTASKNTGCHSSCSSASSEEYNQAQQLGLTVGKYRAYLALCEAGLEVSPEEVRNMTMRELRDMISAAGGSIPKGEGMHSYQGNGLGHGQGAAHGSGYGNGSGGGHRHQQANG